MTHLWLTAINCNQLQWDSEIVHRSSQICHRSGHWLWSEDLHSRQLCDLCLQSKTPWHRAGCPGKTVSASSHSTRKVDRNHGKWETTEAVLKKFTNTTVKSGTPKIAWAGTSCNYCTSLAILIRDSKFVCLVSNNVGGKQKRAAETCQTRSTSTVFGSSAKPSWISGRVFLTTSAFRSWHLEMLLSGMRTNLILEQPGNQASTCLIYSPMKLQVACQHSCLVCNSMWNMQMCRYTNICCLLVCRYIDLLTCLYR